MKYFFFLFCIFRLNAVFVGNPLNPNLYQDGIISCGCRAFSMRLGYIQECIYKGKYEDEFKTIESTNSDNSLSTYGGILTFNFLNRLDVYGMLGNSRLIIDEVIFDKRRISWAAGAKALIYKKCNLALGIDIKHFETKSKPNFFVLEGMPAPLLTDFKLEYEETQGAVCIAYISNFLSPYIGATYLFSRITPIPNSGALNLQNFDMIVDFEIKKATNRKRWGMVIGATLLNCQTITLNLESRIFDQNSINITSEVRF
jgi:hypothetical protein